MGGPDEDRFKVNVDASLVPGAHSFPIGMVIQNHHDEFVQVKNLRCAGEILVFEAEVRGVLEAITWIQSMQMISVDIEIDSLLIAYCKCLEERSRL